MIRYLFQRTGPAGIFVSALVFLFPLLPVSAEVQTSFFVSPNGNDGNPGTREKPFATLQKARDSIREIKNTRIFPCEGVTVDLRGGDYPQENGFVLNGYDGGLEDTPIVYRAYGEELVRILGGKAIPPEAIRKVTAPDILDRLSDPSARDHLYSVDLKDLGIEDYGQVASIPNQRAELFLNHRYLTLARYPNEDWLHIADVPQNGESIVNEGRPDWVIDGIPRGRHYGRFQYSENRLGLWSDKNDIHAHGYWVYDWRDEILRIAKIDKTKKEIYPQEPHHGYGYQKGSKYYFLNLLEEIDSPGEWYLDRSKGILYLWKPEEIQEGELIFPTLSEPLFRLENVSHVVIRGITLEASRAGGIEITGGAKVRIEGCRFVNLGNTAIMIRGGVNHGVQSCDIHDVSGAGIDMTGGDRKTLQPGGHFAQNNHIHHFARVNRCYQPAIRMNGVGLRASHNSIHDAPHEGIEFGGNDLVMEYNDFSRLCLETGDVGAIYTAQDWTFGGIVIRYNYFHTIHGAGRYVDAKGVYLDLPVGGTIVYGNIFYDLDSGFFTNSGRGILIENNIFIKCRHNIQFNVYRAPDHFVLGGPWKLVEKLQDMNYKEPPYAVRYPWLPKVLSQGDDPAIGGGNVVRKNISFSRGGLILHEDLDFDLVKVNENIIADQELCDWRNDFQDPAKKTKTYKAGDETMTKWLESHGNIVMNTDPGFEDVEKENFRLKNDSPAHPIGFKLVPFEKIGLIPDEFRKHVSKSN